MKIEDEGSTKERSRGGWPRVLDVVQANLITAHNLEEKKSLSDQSDQPALRERESAYLDPCYLLERDDEGTKALTKTEVFEAFRIVAPASGH